MGAFIDFPLHLSDLSLPWAWVINLVKKDLN